MTTRCAYCGSLDGGHTMACSSIHMDGPKPRQVPYIEPAKQDRASPTAHTAAPRRLAKASVHGIPFSSHKAATLAAGRINDLLRAARKEAAIAALTASGHAEMVEALEAAEACMSIVEPRSDKAEYLRILGVVRAAIAKGRASEQSR